MHTYLIGGLDYRDYLTSLQYFGIDFHLARSLADCSGSVKPFGGSNKEKQRFLKGNLGGSDFTRSYFRHLLAVLSQREIFRDNLKPQNRNLSGFPGWSMV